VSLAELWQARRFGGLPFSFMIALICSGIGFWFA
jgi:hypothetical protein